MQNPLVPPFSPEQKKKTAQLPNTYKKNDFSPHKFSPEEMRAKILHKNPVKFPKS